MALCGDKLQKPSAAGLWGWPASLLSPGPSRRWTPTLESHPPSQAFRVPSGTQGEVPGLRGGPVRADRQHGRKDTCSRHFLIIIVTLSSLVVKRGQVPPAGPIYVKRRTLCCPDLQGSPGVRTTLTTLLTLLAAEREVEKDRGIHGTQLDRNPEVPVAGVAVWGPVRSPESWMFVPGGARVPA